MTRKDYIAFAKAFAQMRDLCLTRGEHDVLDHTIVAVADLLALDNAQFDRARFYNAASKSTHV